MVRWFHTDLTKLVVCHRHGSGTLELLQQIALIGYTELPISKPIKPIALNKLSPKTKCQLIKYLI